MRLSRPSAVRLAALGLLVCAAAVLAADPAVAQSSLGIGTAEVTVQPSGPLAGLFVEINRHQRAFFVSLREALVAMKNGTGGVAFLVALSFAYGVFHAAGPGHGKAVISAYMLANEVQLKRGIALSFISALLQATTAILVVGAVWFFLRGTSVSMTDATTWLEIVSYALIAAFGGWLLVAKIAIILRRPKFPGGLDFAPSRAGGAELEAARGGGAAALASGAPSFSTRSVPGRAMTGASARAGARAIMQPASNAFAADVCADTAEDCDCGRAHMVDPSALSQKRLTLGSAASAVLAVGLRPCSGAIVVLSFALLNGLYLGGVMSVLAMALGTAITVSAIAAMAVFAKGAALRFGAAGGVRRRVLDGVELLGAGLVLVLGLLLLGSALA